MVTPAKYEVGHLSIKDLRELSHLFAYSHIPFKVTESYVSSMRLAVSSRKNDYTDILFK